MWVCVCDPDLCVNTRTGALVFPYSSMSVVFPSFSSSFSSFCICFNPGQCCSTRLIDWRFYRIGAFGSRFLVHNYTDVYRGIKLPPPLFFSSSFLRHFPHINPRRDLFFHHLLQENFPMRQWDRGGPIFSPAVTCTFI